MPDPQNLVPRRLTKLASSCSMTIVNVRLLLCTQGCVSGGAACHSHCVCVCVCDSNRAASEGELSFQTWGISFSSAFERNWSRNVCSFGYLSPWWPRAWLRSHHSVCCFYSCSSPFSWLLKVPSNYLTWARWMFHNCGYLLEKGKKRKRKEKEKEKRKRGEKRKRDSINFYIADSHHTFQLTGARHFPLVSWWRVEFYVLFVQGQLHPSVGRFLQKSTRMPRDGHATCKNDGNRNWHRIGTALAPRWAWKSRSGVVASSRAVMTQGNVAEPEMHRLCQFKAR